MSMSKSSVKIHLGLAMCRFNLLLTRKAPINCSTRQILFLSLFLILFYVIMIIIILFIYLFFNFTDFFFRVCIFQRQKSLTLHVNRLLVRLFWPT